MRVAILVGLLPALLSGCVAEKEGDFAIDMPSNRHVAQAADDQELVTLEIQLNANDHGDLSGVFFRGQQLVVDEGDNDVFDALNRCVREIVQDPDGQALDSRGFEAVIHVNGTLDYAFVVSAITAISSYADPNDTVHQLVTRVRFVPNTNYK